jgi:AAA+ superfamily predicted ATPase
MSCFVELGDLLQIHMACCVSRQLIEEVVNSEISMKKNHKVTNGDELSVKEKLNDIAIYQNSKQHLYAELKRIELLLQAQLLYKQQFTHSASEWSHFFISDQEAVHCLSNSTEDHTHTSLSAETLAVLDKLRQQLQQTRNLIAEQVQASIAAGKFLRLLWLAQVCNLSQLDVDILLLALAPAVESRYQRLYAYLQDDLQKKALTVGLALQLTIGNFNQDWSARQAARVRFAASMPLMSYRLLRLRDEGNLPLIGQQIQVDERIIDYLLEQDILPEQMAGYAQWKLPQQTLEQLIGTDFITPAVLTAIQKNIAAKNLIFVSVAAMAGTGRKTLVEAVCQQLKMPLLIVNVKRLLSMHSVQDFPATLISLCRESLLQRAALVWEHSDDLWLENMQLQRADFFRLLAQFRGLHFLLTQQAKQISELPSTCQRFDWSLPPFTAKQRYQLWQHLQEKLQIEAASSVDLQSLAERFQLTPGQIADAWRTARDMAIARQPKKAQVQPADLQKSCHLQSQQALNGLAQRITPRYGWDDLVLPPSCLALLDQLRGFLKHQSHIYEQWGFADKMSLGKGVYALLSGPPGTGKTMAAEVLADELGLELYKIDLSMMVSKYIGETEKHLQRIFDQAQGNNAILFFDEADALFGKRSEVKDAHDRFANIETSYLLQKLEEHTGVIILATNFRRNIDEAFIRRLHFCIEFPFPTLIERQTMWEKVWPQQLPRETLDMQLLAQRFELAGANIRSIALAAAFLAINEQGKQAKVSMQHVLQAAHMEYQKLGRIIVAADFKL